MKDKPKTGAAFTEKPLSVVRDSLDSTETATVRYYEDLPSVPYMSVTDFYNRFYLVNTELAEGMTFEREDSRYTVTNFCGDAAVFDIDADTVVIDNMDRFIKLACDLQSSGTGGMDPDYPYAMITHKTEPEKAAPKTLALAEYDIDLRGDDTGVYAPLDSLLTQFYGALLYEDIDEKNAEFDGLIASCTDSLMRQHVALAIFDHYRFSRVMGEEAVAVHVLMLFAGDFETFYAGLNHVFNGLLFDGGHSAMDCDVLMMDELELSKQIMKDVKAKDYGRSYVNTSQKVARGEQREEIRKGIYDGDIYVEQGDTAMISLESEFMVDFDGWKAFYAGKGERPLAEDTVGTVLTGLERAAGNPEIKNMYRYSHAGYRVADDRKGVHPGQE